ncbi:MAG: SGNH/GDSL hydrolase family protein [Akkermansiaceae bacterium]|nr:SGNH/GDSL hydrolase family protein [Akkermansiaceae bacterium]
MKRRHILTTSALATGASFLQTTAAQETKPKISLKKGDVILFQGDSITDAGRGRKEAGQANNPGALGHGYPLFIGSDLLGSHPSLDLQIYNRGISGHKVPQLQARWQKDTLDLKPAVLSILIGVNDMWHKMNGQYDGTVESYRNGFDALIKDTKKNLPDTTIVICEPFALRCGAIKDNWFPEFDHRRAAAKEVAQKNNALWVPFQTIFDEAIAAGSKPEHWAGDGVHPTFSGHSLMAQTWRKVVGI